MYRYIKREELNDYELQHNRLSYKNLFYKDDSLILCNNIANDYEELEQQSGFDHDGDDYGYDEIYQYYIIDDSLASRLIEIDEIVFYHNRLDIYVLGVTHYGTSWGYILTNLELIDCNDGYFKAIQTEAEEVE